MKRAKFKPRAWFRHYAEARGDARLQLLAFEDRAHWWRVLELKCDGTLDSEYPSDELRERALANCLGLDLQASKEVKRRLIEVGLIREDWHPKAWNRRQFESDTSTDRVKKHRGKLNGNGHAGNVKRSRNVSETPSEQSRAESEQKQIRSEGAREPAQLRDAARAPAPKLPDKQQATRTLRQILDRTTESARG